MKGEGGKMRYNEVFREWIIFHGYTKLLQLTYSLYFWSNNLEIQNVFLVGAIF